MAPHPVHKDWQRLGKLLKQRRPQLNPRYRTRRTFAEENHLNDKTVQEIENAYRPTFSDTMLAAIEVAYQLPAGTIARVLDDPSITELPTPAGEHRPDRGSVNIPHWVDLRDLPEWEQHIWGTPQLTVEQREAAILLIRLERGDLDDDTDGLLRLYHALGRVVERRLHRNNPPRAV